MRILLTFVAVSIMLAVGYWYVRIDGNANYANSHISTRQITGFGMRLKSYGITHGMLPGPTVEAAARALMNESDVNDKDFDFRPFLENRDIYGNQFVYQVFNGG